jgi:hypothetical protein
MTEGTADGILHDAFSFLDHQGEEGLELDLAMGMGMGIDSDEDEIVWDPRYVLEWLLGRKYSNELL